MNAPFVYQLGFDVFTVEKPGQHRQGVPFPARMIPKSVKRFSDKIMRKKIAGSFSGQDVAF